MQPCTLLGIEFVVVLSSDSSLLCSALLPPADGILETPLPLDSMAASQRVAIVGAGPVGVEAAVRAVKLGLDVCIIERGMSIAANVREWQHVELFRSLRALVECRLRAPLASTEVI